MTENPGEPEYANSFFVPVKARWANILQLHDNVGDELNETLAALEEHNEELAGVLGHINFLAQVNQKRRVKDAQLVDLIHHFNKLRLYTLILREGWEAIHASQLKSQIPAQITTGGEHEG